VEVADTVTQAGRSGSDGIEETNYESLRTVFLANITAFEVEPEGKLVCVVRHSRKAIILLSWIDGLAGGMKKREGKRSYIVTKVGCLLVDEE
jgi:hypothetical protein